MQIDDIINDVYLDIPGVALEILKQQLRLTARDFCAKTDAWVEYIAKDVKKDVVMYNLTTGSSSNICNIFWVKYGEDATEEYEKPIHESKYRLVDEYRLKLLFTPTENITGGLYVKVSLRPTYKGLSNDTVDLPEWFLDRYAEGLACGTKARLMFMAKKPWTDREASAFYTAKYNGAVINAINDLNYKQFTHKPVTVEMTGI